MDVWRLLKDARPLAAARGPFPARRWLPVALIVLGPTLSAMPAAAATDLAGPALVRADGTLRVQGRTVHLFGTLIPFSATERTCRFVIRPIRCAPRPVLALATKVQGLVRCEVVRANRDGTVEAVCFVDGDSILAPDVDLGAWMIEQGWAVATPEAPFEYTVLEKIARSRGLGVWGFPVDDVRRRGWLRP